MPEKKDPYSSPSLKVLELYCLLMFTGREYSLTRLAEIFRCSKQTVLRMMEQLERAQRINLESRMDGGRRWYSVRTPAVKPRPGLSVEDIQSLYLCRDILMNLLPASMMDEVDRSIEHATVLLPDFETRAAASSAHASSYMKGTIDYTDHHENIRMLIAAMSEEKMCRIEYRSNPNAQPKTYLAAPIEIVAYRDALYLRCVLNGGPAGGPGEERTFAIHRITGLEVTDRTFDFEAMKRGNDKSSGFGFIEGEPFRVKVLFSPRVSYYIAERKWSDDQIIKFRKDMSAVLEFTVRSRDEAINWLLSFGPEAEVLEPQDLREEIVRAFEDSLKIYKK